MADGLDETAREKNQPAECAKILRVFKPGYTQIIWNLVPPLI